MNSLPLNDDESVANELNLTYQQIRKCLGNAAYRKQQGS